MDHIAQMRRVSGGLLPETRDLIGRMATTPDNTRRRLIDRTIRALRLAGVWHKLDLLYLFAAHDEDAALQNWKGDDFSITNINAMPFTADRGFNGNGASVKYLLTDYVMGNGQSSATSLTFGRLINRVGPNARYDIGVASGSGNAAYIRSGTDGLSVFAGASSGGGVSVNSGLSPLAHLACVRTATLLSAFRNGALIGSNSSSPGIVNNASFVFGGYNSAGSLVSYADSQMSCAYVGAALTADQMVALNSALQYYVQAVGAAP